MNTAPNSPFKGYYPNVNPFGVSPRYTPGSMSSLYAKMTDNKEDITETIKPIEREKANIEAEKNEVLLTFKPTGLAMHSIKGKSHSKGGTPLNVEEGSFIFSNDKSMSLTKEEIETYDLGKFLKGGSIKNTPASVLKRTVDLKHNNKMIDYLANSTNFAEKTTAMKMLEKYQKVAGSIAALQEARKETEMPSFAQLTPKNPMIETQKEQQEQYSKGGYVRLPKAYLGLNVKKKIDPYFKDSQFPLYNQQSILNTLKNKPLDGSLIKPIQPLGVNFNNAFKTMTSDPVDNSTVTAPETSDIQDDFSWIKPYNWTPKALSMLGNQLQSPKPYYPSLALNTPGRLREQTMSEQPGVNAALATAYASRKANNMYGSPQLQNNQLVDSQAIKMAQDYSGKVQQANLAQSNDVNNRNVMMSTDTMNQNNQLRGQYKDKLNELYQNVGDTRRAITATNLGLLGEGINQQDTQNMTIDYLKRYQPYNVNSKMTQTNYADLMEKYNQISSSNPQLTEAQQLMLMKSLFAPYQKQAPDNTMLSQMINLRNNN